MANQLPSNFKHPLVVTLPSNEPIILLINLLKIILKNFNDQYYNNKLFIYIYIFYHINFIIIYSYLLFLLLLFVILY
jgi:hypothetical protein